ncbi:Rad52/Rad22 family DNA repair protein [Streptomyces rimosus]|uniref:Rad52/Rad22 family DNA repair protein n=1 Tax=Streptomyces rimosus TaxID=1927 RepID=UPI00067E17D9|nr:Rad52/Rad22 family DNA repair protein [Streptomyces rimosus]
MSTLTRPQLKVLLAPVSPQRISTFRGLAHMEAWDIRRQLIRVFGFGGYSIQTLALDLVAEHSEQLRKKDDGGRPCGDPYTAWTVVYRAQVRLTVYATDGRRLGAWDDGAVGDAVHQPSHGDAHDMALKTALSQALKRCATNLGDQFGLSLYDDGSREAVVRWSAAHPPRDGAAATSPSPDLNADPPVRPEPNSPQPAEAAPAGRDTAAEHPAPPDGNAAAREAALAGMWDAARQIHFAADLPTQFADTFGHPVAEGTTAEFRQARALMLGGPVA